jgi:Tetracyclin repressor-like, C-terminal domain
MSMLEHYVEPYGASAATPDRVCLCGALSGEVLALTRESRERVARFFKSHQQWLTQILKRGAARGEFKLTDSPAKTARLIFGALQGGLLIQRTTARSAFWHHSEVASAILASLLPWFDNRKKELANRPYPTSSNGWAATRSISTASSSS